MQLHKFDQLKNSNTRVTSFSALQTRKPTQKSTLKCFFSASNNFKIGYILSQVYKKKEKEKRKEERKEKGEKRRNEIGKQKKEKKEGKKLERKERKLQIQPLGPRSNRERHPGLLV